MLRGDRVQHQLGDLRVEMTDEDAASTTKRSVCPCNLAGLEVDIKGVKARMRL